MARDWDVIREVLMEIDSIGELERHKYSYAVSPKQDEAENLRGEQAIILYRAKYIDGSYIEYLSEGVALKAPTLTWEGRDLLDKINSKPVWDRIKTVAEEKGLELTFDTVKALAGQAIAWVAGS